MGGFQSDEQNIFQLRNERVLTTWDVLHIAGIHSMTQFLTQHVPNTPVFF